MDITVNNDWTETDDYKVSFATTSDPRVLAVIRNQSDEDGCGGAYIDGDCYAPAFYFERGGKTRAGSTFTDDASDSIAEAYANAKSYFVNRHYRKGGRQMNYDEVTKRYLRIFHDTTIAEASSSVIRGMDVVIFNTPTWREHIGWTDEYAAQQDEDIRLTDKMLEGEQEEWTAALDGDVFGIGWAINEARRMDDVEIDYDDFEEDIQVWSFIGERYAKESAARWDGGTPDLPPMIDIAA